MTVEGWKQIFDVATVVLLFLTFACGAGVLITTNAINKRQESQLRQFDKDLTGAKTELGKQQERAAKAEQGVAGLEEAASDAKAAQQRVETELAAQQERAAKAEKALVELQQRASPRRITKEQADKFRSAFEFTNRLHNPRIALAFMVGVPDAEDFANDLKALLESVGYSVEMTGGGAIRFDNPIGITLTCGNTRVAEATAIANAVAAAHLQAPPLRANRSNDADELDVFVGMKPIH